jgi:ubiquinone/menaquinone biosynthesis methyltransferase
MTLESAFSSPEAKRRHVRALFATIADRYDLITVLLSFGRDQAWKRRLVSEAGVRPDARVIDVACGTGDIAFEATRRGARVTGLDVTERMIQLARVKAIRAEAAGLQTPPQFVVGDMMALPFPTESADAVTTGYGLRNVPELNVALDEIARVLKPGGCLVSLDFNRPRSGIVRAAYLGYLTVVGASLGWVLHGDPDTYRYIPESVRRYPGAEGVAARLRERGFDDVRVVRVFGGFMTLHVAKRHERRRAPGVMERGQPDTKTAP